MKKYNQALIWILLILPMLTSAQIEQGMHFEKGLSWEQIRLKAKTEHKFIFVDCFATWCGPCKKMDREVYPNDTVGNFMNSAFISVKMQLDTSKNDNEEIKDRYADAHLIMVDYKVKAFPTFLFFSPNGKLVHRGLGFLAKNDFINIAKASEDPTKQFYTLLEKYNNKALDHSQIPRLVELASLVQENEIRKQIGKDYMVNYLPTLTEKQFTTRDNLVMAGQFAGLIHSSDPIFQWILHHQNETNVIVDSKRMVYAGELVNNIMVREEITDKLWMPNNAPYTLSPDWTKMGSSIRNKYGFSESYTDSLIYPRQFEFYEITKNWIAYAHCAELAMKKFPPKDLRFNKAVGSFAAFNDDYAYGLNLIAWRLFQYSKDKAILKKALEWSELSIKIAKGNPGAFIDTKANLLYKLGEIEEAIKTEKKAMESDPKILEYQKTLAMMQNGNPTWQ